MKNLNILKSIPILSTLIIIFFICISNQKESTKIKFLIWNTPSLSLGTYLSITSGAGFIISYVLTSSLIKVHQKFDNALEDQQDELIETNDSQESINYISNENILIERNIKDPSPTIQASFRVIGNTNKKNQSSVMYNNNSNVSSHFDEEVVDKYYEKDINYKDNDETTILSDDWNDNSHSNW